MKEPLIIRAGRALFGTQWQSDMARAVGVNDRTARYWAAKKQEPRPGVLADLAQVCRERSAALLTLAEELDAEASKGFSSTAETESSDNVST